MASRGAISHNLTSHVTITYTQNKPKASTKGANNRLRAPNTFVWYCNFFASAQRGFSISAESPMGGLFGKLASQAKHVGGYGTMETVHVPQPRQ